MVVTKQLWTYRHNRVMICGRNTWRVPFALGIEGMVRMMGHDVMYLAPRLTPHMLADRDTNLDWNYSQLHGPIRVTGQIVTVTVEVVNDVKHLTVRDQDSTEILSQFHIFVGDHMFEVDRGIKPDMVDLPKNSRIKSDVINYDPDCLMLEPYRKIEIDLDDKQIELVEEF